MNKEMTKEMPLDMNTETTKNNATGHEHWDDKKDVFLWILWDI